MADVTQILAEIERGDVQAADQLLPLVYQELRKLAAAKMAQERPGQTLEATALVHEAYLRLVGGRERESAGQEAWKGRGHFFAAAAEAMRRILIEQARRKQAAKRGAGRERVDLVEIPGKAAESAVDLLTLDEALTELAAVEPRAAELVKLRYFAGLTGAEAAQVLGISPRSADRTWLFARTWLLRRLEGD